MGAGAAVASNVMSSIRTALIQSFSYREEGPVRNCCLLAFIPKAI